MPNTVLEQQLEHLLARLEAPVAADAPDWKRIQAARWSVQPGEAIEEKISLFDRCRLWVSFHSMDQDTDPSIARHWGILLTASPDASFERAALQWSTERGARNGRVAWQLARGRAGWR